MTTNIEKRAHLSALKDYFAVDPKEISPSWLSVDVQELEMPGDVLIYTYGVGPGGKYQETPNYTFELARKNPDKRIDLIHCDPAFKENLKNWQDNKDIHNAPWCFQSNEWRLISSKEDHFCFQHTVYPNLFVKLICRVFPDFNFRASFAPVQGLITKKLAERKLIFLGVHSNCFRDDSRLMFEIFNHHIKQYPESIRLYIQAADISAFIYKGEPIPLFGKFALRLSQQNMSILQKFISIFKGINPSQKDALEVENEYKKFLAAPHVKSSVISDLISEGQFLSDEEYLKRCKLYTELFNKSLRNPNTSPIRTQEIQNLTLADFAAPGPAMAPLLMPHPTLPETATQPKVETAPLKKEEISFISRIYNGIVTCFSCIWNALVSCYNSFKKRICCERI